MAGRERNRLLGGKEIDDWQGKILPKGGKV